MNPHIDYHALAPEIILSATIVVVLVADLLFPDRERWQTSRIATIGVLAAMIPVLTLAADGTDRSMFGGAYVVDNYALVFKGFFLVVTYVTILLSSDYIAEGDYYQGEFWFLLLTSVLGMVAMASARDLITIFVALETISLPTFVLAGWRKHDTRSNEASIKYYLIGVLSSAVMLYGMSLIYGVTSSTLLTDISNRVANASGSTENLLIVAIFLTLIGFAFKVSAVPFHFWAPDTYEGAPTPVTAFLSVASKAGGFVALLTIVLIGFYSVDKSWQPILWGLAAVSMTVGNLTALRQTNIVRMLAYSSIAQGGFLLVPFAVAQESLSAANSAREAVIIYILIYGAMNLGAFAVVIAVARRTRSAEIDTYSGLGQWAPTLALMMTIFLFSLAGIPPLAGWFAKFVMFRAVFDAHTAPATVLGVIAAVNSVIAFFYYAAVARKMWFHAPTIEDTRPLTVPPALNAAIALCAATVLVIGVYPQPFAKLGELARFAVG
jgi:NADH-quinone oxidoreductase subunit N